jgi:hypothetical protein
MKTKTLPVVDNGAPYVLREFMQNILKQYRRLRVVQPEVEDRQSMADYYRMQDTCIETYRRIGFESDHAKRFFAGPTLTDPLPATHPAFQRYLVCVGVFMPRPRPQAWSSVGTSEAAYPGARSPVYRTASKGVDEKLGGLVVNLNTKNCGDREIQQERWLLDMWLR